MPITSNMQPRLSTCSNASTLVPAPASSVGQRQSLSPSILSGRTLRPNLSEHGNALSNAKTAAGVAGCFSGVGLISLGLFYAPGTVTGVAILSTALFGASAVAAGIGVKYYRQHQASASPDAAERGEAPIPMQTLGVAST